MKNWKTTLFGLIMAVSGAITSGAVDTGSPQVRNIASIVQSVAMAALGMSTKDKDVTGVGKEAKRVTGL